MALFLSAVAATLTISVRAAFPERFYEGVVFLLGMLWSVREIARGRQWPRRARVQIEHVPPRDFCVVAVLALAAISLWGFVQLAFGATVYPAVTWDAALRLAALGATAFLAARVFRAVRLRLAFLRCFAWFGWLVSITAVTAYYSSPGKLLWVFPSAYPDTWGPFLSRNDFAGFLELTLPVALWLMLSEDRSRRVLYLSMAASMLAAGIASASRAGSVLLLVETGAVFVLFERTRVSTKAALQFVLATSILVAIAGAGTLAGRFADPDPLRYRREIANSALHMIADRPWTGFGLGTFSIVYPAYATFDSGARVEHAHNDWFEWAAEGGLPFAVVWMLLALVTACPALRSGWAIGIVAALLHALVDYPFARLGLAAWTFVLIGAAMIHRGSDDLREVVDAIH